jgi:hypothetical protein
LREWIYGDNLDVLLLLHRLLVLWVVLVLLLSWQVLLLLYMLHDCCLLRNRQGVLQHLWLLLLLL